MITQDVSENNIQQGVCGQLFWSQFFPWSDLGKRLRNALKKKKKNLTVRFLVQYFRGLIPAKMDLMLGWYC